MAQQRSRGGSAALWGIIFGLILAALDVLHQLVVAGAVRRALGPGTSLIYTALALLIAAALYFVAGLLAARRANALEAGVFAGLIAGVIVGATALALTLIVLALRPPLVVRHPGLVRAAEIAGVVRAALGVVVQALIGAGLGALGGLAGRRPTPPVASGPYTPYTPYAPYTPPQPASPPAPGAPQQPASPPPYTQPQAPYTPLPDDAPTITPQR